MTVVGVVAVRSNEARVAKPIRQKLPQLAEAGLVDGVRKNWIGENNL